MSNSQFSIFRWQRNLAGGYQLPCPPFANPPSSQSLCQKLTKTLSNTEKGPEKRTRKKDQKNRTRKDREEPTTRYDNRKNTKESQRN